VPTHGGMSRDGGAHVHVRGHGHRQAYEHGYVLPPRWRSVGETTHSLPPAIIRPESTPRHG
jgi:hypothetical protein